MSIVNILKARFFSTSILSCALALIGSICDAIVREQSIVIVKALSFLSRFILVLLSIVCIVTFLALLVTESFISLRNLYHRIWPVTPPDSICIVCLTNPKEFLSKPCNHFSLCEECIRLLDECPICRSIIEHKERIYTN